MCECALKIILLFNICLSPATIYRPKLYALARSGRRATDGENNDDDDVNNKPCGSRLVDDSRPISIYRFLIRIHASIHTYIYIYVCVGIYNYRNDVLDMTGSLEFCLGGEELGGCVVDGVAGFPVIERPNESCWWPREGRDCTRK